MTYVSGTGELIFNNAGDRLTIGGGGLVTIAQNLVVSGTGNTTIAGNVGIGTTSTLAKLHVANGSAGLTGALHGSFDDFAIENSASGGMTILTSNTSVGGIAFGDTNSSIQGLLAYDHATNAMAFWVNGAERLTINNAGNVGIGTTGPIYKLDTNGNFRSKQSTLSVMGEVTSDGAAANLLPSSVRIFQANTGWGVISGVNTRFNSNSLKSSTGGAVIGHEIYQNTIDTNKNHFYGFAMAADTGSNISGKTYAVSAWVKGTAGHYGGIIVTSDTWFTNGGSSYNYVFTGDWQRISTTVTFATQTTNPNNIYLRLSTYGPNPDGQAGTAADIGTKAWYSSVQVELGSSVTAFVDGSRSAGDMNVGGALNVGGNIVATGTISASGTSNLSTLTVTGNTYLATTNGNVGIGTTGPGALLEVRKDQNAFTSIMVNNTTVGASAKAGVQFGYNGNEVQLYSDVDGSTVNAHLRHTLNAALVFDTQSTERWRITGTGILQSSGAQTIQTSDGALSLLANSATLSIGGTSGNVGIGTTSPVEKLEVAGNIKLTGRIRQGNMGDMAEMMTLSKAALTGSLKPEPEDVVIVDQVGGIMKCNQVNSPLVIGIISTNPAHILMDGLPDSLPVALSGIVPCKVSDEKGLIEPGDLLVSASMPGYAMKAGPDPAPGTVIAKALEQQKDKLDSINVLVMMR